MREYSFSHISDLAQLEDEHIDLFIKELPTMIRGVKATVELLNVVGSAVSGKDTTDIDLAAIMPVVTWKPDGKNEAISDLTYENQSLFRINFTNEDDQ